jgi:hypothetical protein
VTALSRTVHRATFVGTGIASVALTTASASAQAYYGKPHPPIVAENDPAITIVRPMLSSGVSGYAAMPKNVTPTTPGVVQTMAIWGIDAQLRDVVRRYAKAGYICIAPDIYGRSPAPNADNAGSEEYTRFQGAAAAMQKNGKQLDDLRAGRDWIRTVAARAKVGVTGFCMGGGIAIAALIGTHDYDAARSSTEACAREKTDAPPRRSIPSTGRNRSRRRFSARTERKTRGFSRRRSRRRTGCSSSRTT